MEFKIEYMKTPGTVKKEPGFMLRVHHATIEGIVVIFRLKKATRSDNFLYTIETPISMLGNSDRSKGYAFVIDCFSYIEAPLKYYLFKQPLKNTGTIRAGILFNGKDITVTNLETVE